MEFLDLQHDKLLEWKTFTTCTIHLPDVVFISIHQYLEKFDEIIKEKGRFWKMG